MRTKESQKSAEKRAEKLEENLKKVEDKLAQVRKELHASQQKNRDIVKSREFYKAQVKAQELNIKGLESELQKKTPHKKFLNVLLNVINTQKT
ncbi:MAG: hypothetical protein LBH82_05590 [Bacteroidales bacterium]|jgi:chromosome segregation ATPase|nr:hypothetical protein [Bacteroidales bacterium]